MADAKLTTAHLVVTATVILTLIQAMIILAYERKVRPRFDRIEQRLEQCK